MVSYWVQNRRDTASNWTSYNPVLRPGEIGHETDTNRSKMGDGVTSWRTLPYWNPSGASFSAIQGASYPDQLPGLSYGMTSSSPLMPVFEAILNRDSARVDIPVIGDSVTEGQGATAFGSRWIAKANQAIRAAYPTAAAGSSGGLGFIPFQHTGETSYTWPVTLASGSVGTLLDLGPVRMSGGFNTATAVWTFTAPVGTTSVKITYYDGADTAGGFTYQLNSGSVTTVNNTATLLDKKTPLIKMTGGDVLTISAMSGPQNCYITGLLHYAGDETSGVTFHGCGHYGWCAGTESNGWSQPEPYSLNWAQAYVNSFDNTVAVAIMLGINDADASDGRRTASQFAADLTGLMSIIRSGMTDSDIPFILVIEYKPDITVSDPGGWPAYVNAVRTVAANDGNSYVIDLSYRLPADDLTSPLWADGYHPANTGHALIGSLVAGAMEGVPSSAGSQPGSQVLQPVASTGINGFALQNATPTVLSWTAPNDGRMHRAVLYYSEALNSSMTGGQIEAVWQDPAGNGVGWNLIPPATGTGYNYSVGFVPPIMVKPGGVVQIVQSTAMTAGSAILFAEIWAS